MMNFVSNCIKVIEKSDPSKPSRNWPFMNLGPYRLERWEEILGKVDSVEDMDNCCAATIASRSILLPQKFTAILRETIGLRVAILRTDRDYRMRIIHPKNATEEPLFIIEEG